MGVNAVNFHMQYHRDKSAVKATKTDKITSGVTTAAATLEGQSNGLRATYLNVTLQAEVLWWCVCAC